jgi:hypothetical protein
VLDGLFDLFGDGANTHADLFGAVREGGAVLDVDQGSSVSTNLHRVRERVLNRLTCSLLVVGRRPGRFMVCGHFFDRLSGVHEDRQDIRRLPPANGNSTLRCLTRSNANTALANQRAGRSGEQLPTRGRRYVTEPAARRADSARRPDRSTDVSSNERWVTTDQRDDGPTYAIQIGTQTRQRLRRDPFTFPDDPEEDVLSPDVVVSEL